MSVPDISFGFAFTADDPGALFTLHGALLHRCMRDAEVVVVDASAKTSKLSDRFASEIQSIPNLVYERYSGPPSSYLPRGRVMELASRKYVVVCDSHVLFEEGAFDSLLAYYAKNPETSDLVTGPLIKFGGKVSATQQTIYDWERAGQSTPHGVRVFGSWICDKRGVDSSAPAFEIMKHGLGSFSCRREAWPGFPKSFLGYGGGEVYLFEKFRQRGDKAVCLPGFRWWHNFLNYDKPSYRRDWADWCRNTLTAAVDLNRPDLFDAAVWELEKKVPDTLSKVLPEFVRPAGRVPSRRGEPGTHLKKLFASQNVPPCQQCDELAERMNRMGSEQCRHSINDIVLELKPRAKTWLKESKPWAAKAAEIGIGDTALSSILHHHVLSAINLSETDERSDESHRY